MKRKRLFVEGCNDIYLTVNNNISPYEGYLLALPIQALKGPLGSRRLRLPEFIDSWYMKVLKFSVLRTPRKNPSYSFLFKAESAPRPYRGRKD
jgi:hypothetical protein